MKRFLNYTLGIILTFFGLMAIAGLVNLYLIPHETVEVNIGYAGTPTQFDEDTVYVELYTYPEDVDAMNRLVSSEGTIVIENSDMWTSTGYTPKAGDYVKVTVKRVSRNDKLIHGYSFAELMPEPDKNSSQVHSDLKRLPISESGKMLEGEWSYECDVLGFNRYTWTSQMEFDHANMVVQISFDDLNTYRDNNSHLGFIIKSPEPEFEYDWLYVHPDGTIDPELSYFNKYGLMEVYSGGYPAFEKELIAKDIDWVNMYLKAKAEFLGMYIMNQEQCAPVKQLDTQSG